MLEQETCEDEDQQACGPEDLQFYPLPEGLVIQPYKYARFDMKPLNFNPLTEEELSQLSGSSMAFYKLLQKYRPDPDWKDDDTNEGPPGPANEAEVPPGGSNEMDNMAVGALAPASSRMKAESRLQSMTSLHVAENKHECRDNSAAAPMNSLKISWERNPNLSWQEVMEDDLKKFMEIMDQIKTNSQQEYDSWVSSLKLCQSWGDEHCEQFRNRSAVRYGFDDDGDDEEEDDDEEEEEKKKNVS
ncbi:uncharacterized protein O3C94_007723 [Discoglossus pictus]